MTEKMSGNDPRHLPVSVFSFSSPDCSDRAQTTTTSPLPMQPCFQLPCELWGDLVFVDTFFHSETLSGVLSLVTKEIREAESHANSHWKIEPGAWSICPMHGLMQPKWVWPSSCYYRMFSLRPEVIIGRSIVTPSPSLRLCIQIS